MRRIRISLSLILAMLLVLLCAAGAETERGNLEERFENIPRIEHEGVSYQLRGRLTTILTMGISEDDQGLRRADFAMLLVVDDNNKTMSVVELAPNTLVHIPSATEGEEWNMRFDDAFAMGEDMHESSLRMVAEANELLGYEVIEHYFALDMKGIEVVGGLDMAQGTTKEQLKALKDCLMQMSTDQLNDTYVQLGDYIITDLKSGAVVKVIDKADRYEIFPTLDLPCVETDAGEYGTVLTPEEGEIRKLLIDVFFEQGM